MQHQMNPLSMSQKRLVFNHDKDEENDFEVEKDSWDPVTKQAPG